MDTLFLLLDHMQMCEDIADSIGLMGCRTFEISDYTPEDIQYIQEILSTEYKMDATITISEEV